MNFINQLETTIDTKKLMEVMPFDENMTFRMFKGVQLSDELWVSIQASYGHYCTPRKTLKDLSEYTSMEFALMNKEGQFLNVKDVLPSFSKLEEINEHFNGSTYGYVPVRLIETLYQEITVS